MRLALPPGEFKAYLFDCDGTIADSMPLHYLGWKHVLAEWNCEFAEEHFYSLGGMPVAEIIAMLNEQHGLSMPVDDVRRRKEEFYFGLLPRLKGIPEVLEHIELSHGQIPFGVVSGGSRSCVVASLTSLNILDKFETLVCAGDYRRGKPDPEPFLIGAERLGVAPEECLVFEDTDMGIEAATAAGMASIKVPGPLKRVLVG